MAASQSKFCAEPRIGLATVPFVHACCVTWLAFWLVQTLATGELAAAKEPLAFEPPPSVVTAQSRLLLQQAEQLSEAGEVAEAAQVLRDLLDSLTTSGSSAGGEVVQVGRVQRAGTIRTRRFESVSRWIGGRLQQLSESGEQINQSGLSVEAMDALRRGATLAQQKVNTARFAASENAWQHHLLEADLCLEKGWTLRAIAALERLDGRMRFSLDQTQSQLEEDGTPNYVPTGSLAWTLLPLSTAGPESLLRFDAELQLLVQSLEARSSGLTERVFRRIAIASLITPDLIEPNRVAGVLNRIASVVNADVKGKFGAFRDQFALELTAGVSGDVPDRSLNWDLSRPKWNARVPRHTSTNDKTPASHPRVGEVESGCLPYRPAVWEGVVFVNELSRIRGFDVESGEPWLSEQSLIDTQIETLKLLPRDRGVVGVPRGDVQIYDGSLYARVGSAVTGWAPNSKQVPAGEVVGVDLVESREQGRTVSLPGFPLRIDASEFPGGQFEGPPIAQGDLLFVPIAQRSNVGLRRSVAAFDRWTGRLVWKTLTLASGTVAGTEQAHHIAHQELTLVGGYLYYNTNLGAIVCLDPLDGQVQWLTQYSRPNHHLQEFQTPDRYMYRHSPCAVYGGLVYCAPSDCGELFALDATTGDTHWSTYSEDVPDAISILGVWQDSLIVAGDRLVWLDRNTGRTVARFPGAATPGMFNGLPYPRGLGRGTLQSGYVYYPVAGEVLVFSASRDERESLQGIPVPKVHGRIPMDSRGAAGGNLLLLNKRLIYASPSRLMMYK